MDLLFAIVAAYLVGSISFAVVLSAIFRLPDPRTYGSGNPGATNVLRSGKRSAAVLTLLGDATKGALVVWALRSIGTSELAVALAAVAAFVGHLFPIYFGFKGGKGVATAFGILVAIAPMLAAIALGVFAAVLLLTRYVSLGSVLASVGVGIAAVPTYGQTPLAWAAVAMSVLVIARHRTNIQRLLCGQERRVEWRRSQPPSATTESTPSPNPSAAER
ncbi:MAG TPA: glycerol-3-phosphate 1-O-acyltransferase PlsY [Burkholderiales bacterium]|nr:glycerol-3-phosphate 1-O-acyltransferase PlsY [Burkholderiales bacterium]